jgi:hypothetical protein
MLLEAIDPDVDKHAQINDFAFVKTASLHGLIGYKRGAASSFPFIRWFSNPLNPPPPTLQLFGAASVG